MTAPKSADNFINYRFTYLLTYHFGISPTKFLFLIAIFASFELPPSVGKVRLQCFSGWLSSIGRYFIYDSYSVPIWGVPFLLSKKVVHEKVLPKKS